MSAEGKKKRGESGVSNAKNIAFRYGGSKCDYDERSRPLSSRYGNGSLFVRAMLLGSMLGVKFSAPQTTVLCQDRVFNAMSRCTHPTLSE